MDISPLYELRARLRAAMIAGTGLLSEDFRLKRAVEAFAPLEQASPIFAKIGQLAGALLSSDSTDKEELLLDAITLADAVLCTQGTVAVEGKVEPVAGNGGGSAVTNAPYSVVKTLTESLLNSGSGHYSYVVETHRDRPELFKDYRVKAAMIQALGASYAELADTVAEWLKEEDASILPLLQKDFDPRGKKEMVRRIHVMSSIDGEASNEFFVKILPEAEKEVRQALIFALRCRPENVDLLLELTKTEKGNAKKTAYYALAYMEDEKAEAAFRELYQKKPQEAMHYLVYTETKWASRFVAEKLKEQLSPWADGRTGSVISQEQGILLGETLAALPGKSGEEICEVFRMAANLEDRLQYIYEDKKTVFVAQAADEIVMAGRNQTNRPASTFTFQTSIPFLLHQALHCHPEEELCALAMELYEAKGRRGGRREAYFPAAVAAQLLTAGDCCGWLEEQLKGKLFQSNKEIYPLLAGGIDGLRFSEKENAYVLCIERGRRTHPSGEPMPQYSHPVKQDITGRFTDILMRCQTRDIDRVLMNCSGRDEAYCRKLGDYFYDRAQKVEAPRDYLLALKRCDYPKCEGLAISYFSKRGGKFYLYELSGYATILPGDKKAVYEEIQRVYDLYKRGRFQIKDSRLGEERFLDYLEDLKNGIQETSKLYFS